MKIIPVFLLSAASFFFRTTCAQQAKMQHEQLMKSLEQQPAKGDPFNRYLDVYFLQKQLLPAITNHEYVLGNYYTWGYWFHQNNIYSESNENFKAYLHYYHIYQNELGRQYCESNLVFRTLILRIMAFNHYYLGSVADSVKQCFYTAIDSTKNKDTNLYAATLNDLGFYCMETGQTDSALALYRKALGIVSGRNTANEFIGSVRDNIADIYFERGQYMGALPYYEANIELYKSPKPYHATPSKIDEERFVSAGAQAVVAAVKSGMPQKAETLLQQTNSILLGRGVNLAALPQKQAELLMAEQALHQYRRNYAGALRAVLRVNAIHDSLYHVKNTKRIEFERKRSEYDLRQAGQVFELKKKITEEQISALRYERLLLAMLALAFIAVIVLLYKRYTRQKAQNRTMREELTRFTLQLEALSRETTGSSNAEKMQDVFEKYGLSKREIEIIEALTNKKTNAEIAEALFISPNTVKYHIKNIYNKLNISCREQLYAKTRSEEQSPGS